MTTNTWRARRRGLLALSCLTVFPAVANPPGQAPAASAGQQQAQSQFPSADTLLDVALLPGVQRIGDGEYQYECGRIDPFSQKSARASFSLTNVTGHPVLIAAIQPSCSCTTALLLDRTANDRTGTSAPLNLGPGQSIGIGVSVDLASVPAGIMMKSVAVIVAGPAGENVNLIVRGEVEPVVTFLPPTADFGQVQAGTGRSLELRETLDSRAIALGAPDLESSSPFVHIVRIVTQDPAGHAPTPHPAVTVRRYLVSVDASAPIGNILAYLTFGANADRIPGLAGIVLLAVGKVVGEISAQPQQAAFGRIDSTQSAKMVVVLTGQTATALGGLTVASESPLVTADLQAWPGSAPTAPLCRLVTIQLSAGMPAGIFRSNVWVTLASGERLLIPVSAFVP